MGSREKRLRGRSSPRAVGRRRQELLAAARRGSLTALVEAQLDGRLRAVTEDAFAELWSPARWAGLPALDRTLRDIGWGAPSWETSNVDAVRRAERAGQRSLLLAFTSHRNGHVREAALAALGEQPCPDDLGVLLVRWNDWVAPVRARAVTQARALCRPERVAAWRDALPLLEWLRGCGRTDHDDVLSAAEELLRTHGFELLLAALDDPAMTSPAFRIASARVDRRVELLVRAAGHREAVVRRRAARLLGAADAALQAELLPRFAGDRSSAVQCEVLRLQANGDATSRRRAVTDALGARKAVVRRLAQWLARAYGDVDAATFYRDRLATDLTPHERAVALLGIGETGTSADAPLVERHRDDPATLVQAAALRAAARFGMPGVEGWAWHALERGRGALARAGADVLAARALEPRRLAALLHEADVLQRARAARLIGSTAWWDRPALWLVVAAGKDRASASCVGKLQAWAVRTAQQVYSKPEPRQRAAILAALRDHGGAIDSALRSEITALVELRGGDSGAAES